MRCWILQHCVNGSEANRSRFRNVRVAYGQYDPKVMRLFAVSGGILSAIKAAKAVSTSTSDCMSAVSDHVKNFLSVSVMERSRTVLLS